MKERSEQQNGPRREEWLFSYPVSRVLTGAMERLAEHEGRTKFWTDEREKAVDAIKKAGFAVREYEVTGGKDVQVVLDVTLTSRLNQCSQKLREHQGKVKQFKQWVSVLATQSANEHIDLTMDDALYFGVAAGTKENETDY